MRKIYIFILIALFLFTGCSKTDDKKIEVDDFNSLAKVKHTAKLSEHQTPAYFIPQSLTPNGLLFGLSGDSLIGLDPESNQSVTFIERAWSGNLAPDGKKIAYINEKGLAIRTIDTQKTVEPEVPEMEMSSSVALSIWSSDSEKLMYMLPLEWTTEYYIYDLNQGSSSPYKFKNIDNFLSLPVSWNDGQLGFIVSANKSKAGEQEYREAGYRNNFYLADSTGSFTQVTDVNDNCFIEFCGITTDNKKALVLEYDKAKNERRAAVLNPPSNKAQYLPAENVVTASISPDGKYAVVLSQPENGQFNIELYDVSSFTQFFSQTIMGNEPPQYFVWTPEGQLYFGLKNNTANYKLYSLTIS